MTIICEDVSNGELVLDACKTHGVIPREFRRWCEAEEFAPLYARARIDQAHAIAEQALSIAHGEDAVTQLREEAIQREENDLIAADNKNWRKIIKELDANLIQRDRLRVDTVKWMASKIAPRLYGEKLELSGDPERPVAVQIWQFGDKKVTF